MIRIFHLNVVDHHKDFLGYFKLMLTAMVLAGKVKLDWGLSI